MLPLAIPLIEAVANGVAVGSIVGSGVKYIQDSMDTPNRKPVNNPIPTKTKLANLGSRKGVAPLTESAKNILAQKKNLAGLTSGVSAALALGAGVIGAATSQSMTEAQKQSDAQKTANDLQKTKHADSHFLNNQVDLKQSVDYMIDAVNAQTIALFQAISPISIHLASLVTAVNASTDAILGLDPAVTLPALAPVINVPTAPAPSVVVAPSTPTINVSSTAPTVNVSSSPATVNVEAPVIPDYTAQMDRMADSADAVKEHHVYLKTPLMAPDTTTETGSLELSPRDASHAKNAHHARGEADENNIGGDLFSELEEIYDSNELNMIQMFAYTRIDSGFGSLNSADNSAYDSMIDQRYKI